MKRYHLLTTIILFIFSSLSAQTVTLDSCLALAKQNNAAMQNAQLEIQSAQQVKKQALTKYFPKVFANAVSFHALRPMVEFSIEDIDNAHARDLLNTLYAEYGEALGLDKSLSFFHYGTVAGVSAVQPVFVGGQIVNGNRLAQVGVEASQYKAEIVERDLLLQVEESYWLVVSLQEKRKTIQIAKELLDTLYSDVCGAVDAGLTTSNNILKVQLKQNELNSNSLKVENGIRLATMALCQLTGLHYSDTLLLADTLPADFMEPSQYFQPTEQAVGNRSETKLLHLSVEAEQLKKKMTIGQTLPQIALGANYGYGNLFEKNSFNGFLFATLQIPITDWWENSHKIKQQTIAQQVAENNCRDLTEKLQLQTQQLWNHLQESYAQLALATANVEMAQENLTLSQRNYQAGLIGLSELLEAQTLYQQSLDQQNDQKIAYLTALKRYRQYTK